MPATRSSRNRPLTINDNPRSSQTQKNGVTEPNEAWVAKKLQGRYPPLTNHSKSATDPRRGKIYFYGGYRPKDKAEAPTPNFHVFDVKTMKFANLTNSLTHITPGDPDADVKPNPQVKRLPCLSQPGMALLEIGGNPILFLFGGHDPRETHFGPSSALIAINITHKQWSYVEFDGSENHDVPKPAPRVDPIVIGINEKLYIFSGLTGFGDNWVYHRSFSIVDFRLGRRSKWVVVDAPYPENVPPGLVFGKGLSVYEGAMILLLPGREQEKTSIPFQRTNIFYFIPINNTFLQATVKGELPSGVVWYYASNLDRALNSPGGALPYGTPAAVPSVIICTWLPHGDDDLSPELWKFTVFPTNTFVRLGVIDRIYDLEVNFHRFATVGDRAFLMGQGDYPEKAAMCNTYVEIPVRELLIKAEPD